jgi:hypothetical protein
MLKFSHYPTRYRYTLITALCCFEEEVTADVRISPWLLNNTVTIPRGITPPRHTDVTKLVYGSNHPAYPMLQQLIDPFDPGVCPLDTFPEREHDH